MSPPFGCSMSGAGPSLFAVTDNISQAHRIGEAMVNAFRDCHIQSEMVIAKMETDGVRVL